MAKLSAKSGFNLFLGVTLSTLISAIGTILVVRLLGPSQYGLYTIALISPAFIGLFRDWGTNSAMIKYLAQYSSENKKAEIKTILASGALFESALGTVLTLTCYLFAGFLATNIFHRPEMKNLIEIASITILAGSFLTVSQSAFIGFERMEFNSLTMIIQSSLRTLIAPTLVLLGYEAFGAIVGYTVAFLAVGILGIAILYQIFYKKAHGTDDNKPKLSKNIKKMLRYGLPLSISAILGGFLAQFYNFMMAIYCSDLMIGNYQAAVNFAVLITFFTTPITTTLFPAFSKLNPKSETETLRTVFQSSVKYAALLTIPVTAAIMTLSKPLVSTIFGQKYMLAPLFLTLYAINYLYPAAGSLSLENFLNGQEKTEVTMKLTLLNLTLGLPLSLVLIPTFGILGLITTTLASSIPSLATGLWWIKKNYSITVDWPSSTKICLSSGIAATTTYIITSQLNFQNWIQLIAGGTIFLAAYLAAAPLTGAITQVDINNLKEMLGDLEPLSNLFNLPLKVCDKILSMKT